MSLFDDLASWSRSAVATWPRFIFMAAMLVALQFALIYVATTGGWSGATVLAAALAAFQVMFLYALRRLLPLDPRKIGNVRGVA